MQRYAYLSQVIIYALFLQDISAFSRLRYFGVQREGQNGCNETETFSRLRDLVKQELEDTSVRSARNMELIFKAFTVSYC